VALKQNQDLPYGATFNAFGHPKHNGEACVLRRPTEELRPRVFPSLPPLRKSCSPLPKKYG